MHTKAASFPPSQDTLRGRALRPYSLFMHYNEVQHADLVSARGGELGHPVRVVPDDVALVHLEGRGQAAYTWYSDGRIDEEEKGRVASLSSG